MIEDAGYQTLKGRRIAAGPHGKRGAASGLVKAIISGTFWHNHFSPPAN
jgi:hypothetical protein